MHVTKKPLTHLLSVVFTLSVWLGGINNCLAQVSNISYNSPQRYITGTAIPPLVPTYAGTVPNTDWLPTPLAGGQTGYTNGKGAAAAFYQPMGLAMDAAGNLYVADARNNVIRKITSDGQVNTYAGNGTAGFADGAAVSAMFNQPTGLTIDAAGNLYVADENNNRIREVTVSGMVTTIAGGQLQGNTNGPGTSALFNNPTGVAIDGAGVIYVADNGNGQIREITGGVVTKLCGTTITGDNDGPVNQANFTRPYNIVVDRKGNLFLTEQGRSFIREISADGFVTTIRGFNIAGNDVTLEGAFGITVDSTGNIFISDTAGGVIYELATSGLLTTLINGVSGPAGVVIPKTDALYEVESNGEAVQLLSKPINYSISPTLPAGLIFDTATGIITGTPTVTSAQVTYTIMPQNGTATQVIIGISAIQITPPVVTSFSAGNGPIGTTVTITGQNFNATPTGNIVFFGATAATVTAASTTQLTVTVPAGATYQPITVLNTTTKLTGYSRYPFVTTFTSKNSLAPTDFDTPASFTTDGFQATSVAIADLDGDGKPDMVVSNASNNTISLFRNVSSSGSITSASFAPAGTIATASGPTFLSVADMDGDGKPDIVVANYANATGGDRISVFRNTSVNGTISFMPRVDLFSGTLPWLAAIGDIDGDGKPDIIVTNTVSNTLSIFRNTATPGNISPESFIQKTDIFLGEEPWAVTMGDLDGDGKTDLVMVDINTNNISVLRNKSTPGSISTASFAPKVDFPVNASPGAVAIGDIDGDGKPDIAVANEFGGSISVLKNLSVPGTINANSFAPKVDFAVDFPFDVKIADIDGDGKPDLAVANYGYNTIALLRNNGVTGVINSSTFQPQFTLPAANAASIAVGDLDGDGKPDLAAATNSSVTVYRNNSESNVLSFPPIATKTVCDADFDAGASENKPITYTSSNTQVATIVGGNIHITGPGTSAISATDGTTTLTQTLTVAAALSPSITITAPKTAICAGENLVFTAVATGAGTAPNYQWQLNGVNVGINSNTFSSAALNNNDVVSATISNAQACLIPPVATSNQLTITVTPVTTPTITVAADNANVCAGTKITFTASVTNQGSNPAYQWKINGVNAGANSPTLSSTTLQNGDQVTCTLTNNDAQSCVVPAAVTSNQVMVTVISVVTPTITIAVDNPIACAGAKVGFLATVTNQGSSPTYQWKVNGVAIGTNSPTFSSSALQTGDQVTCILTNTEACVVPTGVSSNVVITTVIPTITPTITISSDNADACAGANINFTATVTNQGNNPTYQWKVNGTPAGTNSQTFSSTTLQTGDQVTCTLTSSSACSIGNVTSNAVAVTISRVTINAVTISSSEGTAVLPKGTPITFTAMANNTNQATYQWQVNGTDAGTNSPVFVNSSFNNGDVVTCTVTLAGKCVATPSVTSNAITVAVIIKVVIPNTFTPNSDGINDTWNIPALAGYHNCTVDIFNRWGALIFHSIGYSKPWDGTYNGSALPTGTYYYVIDLKNGSQGFSGYLLLIR